MPLVSLIISNKVIIFAAILPVSLKYAKLN